MKGIDYSVKGYSLRKIRNENEARVCKMMEEIIYRKKYNKICACGICLEDIYGITLNMLSPQYRHASSIKLRKEVKDKEIEAAIIEAIKRVKKRPKHD